MAEEFFLPHNPAERERLRALAARMAEHRGEHLEQIERALET